MGSEQSSYTPAEIYVQVEGGGYTDNHVGTYSEATSSSGVPYTFTKSGSLNLRLIQNYYGTYYFSDYMNFNVIDSGSGNGSSNTTTLSLTLNTGSGNTTGTGVNSLTVNEGDMITFIGKLNPSLTNPKFVLYQNGTKIQNRTFYNGWFSLSMNTPGEYEYYLVYEGNSTHTASTSEKVTVKVLSNYVGPKETVTTISVDDYNPKVGDYLIITPTVTCADEEVNEGNVEIYLGDTLVNSTTAGSTCNYYDLNAPATIKIYAIYKGTDNYKASRSEEIEIFIKDGRIASSLALSANASELAIGDSITIFNNLTNASELDYFTSFASQFDKIYNYSIGDYIPSENITIYLNGDELANTIVNPNGIYRVNYTFSGFDKAGWYNFTARYGGNTKVQGTNTVDVLSFFIEEKAEPIETQTTIDLSALSTIIGKNITVIPFVSANGTAVESGKVDIYVNGEKVTTIDLGSNYEFSSNISGEYNISASFVETEDYKGSSSDNVTVSFDKKASKTISSGETTNVEVGDEVVFTVHVYDADSFSPIEFGVISVYENSEKIASIDVGENYTYIPNTTGFKSIYFLFEGNDEYNKSSGESYFFQVSPKPVGTITTLTLNASEITIGDKILIKPIVTANGELISGFVNLYINGSAVSVIINQDFEIAPQEVGDCEIYAVFEGNSEYRGSESEKFTVVVKELPKETKSAKYLQDLINNAEEGSIIDLGDFAYENISNINITKNLTIKGSENTTISSSRDGSPIFIVPRKSENGPNGFTIADVHFLVNNGDTIVKVIADNGSDDSTIDNPEINIIDNNFTKANDDVVTKSVTVLELDSERTSLSPRNAINIGGNHLDDGIRNFKFEITSLSDGSNFNIPIVPSGNSSANGTGVNGTSASEKIPTVISSKNVVTTAIDTKVDGKKEIYYQLTLKDENGTVLASKTIKVILNNVIYTLKTDAKGIAKLQLNIKKSGSYKVFATFLGDDKYDSSFSAANVKVNKQKTRLSASKKVFKIRAKVKFLKITLKTSKGKAIKSKKITFKIKGKTYTAKTNKKGVAKIKIKLNKRGTFKGTLKVPTDSTYKKLTKKIKIKIK